MKSHLINHRLYFGSVTFLILIVTLLFALAACAGPGEEPTPVQVTPSTEPTVTPTATVTEVPPLEYGIFYPTEEEVQQIVGGIQANPPADGETGHVSPPALQMEDLRGICETLSDPAILGLLNSECEFNEAWATSYTLTSVGLVYQLVSLAAPIEGNPIDDWLSQVGTWGYSLAIGGILVYQEADFSEFALPVDIYLVVLDNERGFQLYNLNLEPLASGNWQLRQLNGQAATPVALITPNELCFSQLIMQACLNVVSPGIGAENPNRDAIQTAVSNLQLSGWLPPNVVVNFDNALASLEGIEKVQACQGDEEGGIQLEACFPNLVVAAIEPLSDTVALAKTAVLGKTLSPPIQVTGSISEAVIGIGVMEVLETLPGEVFNLQGEPVDLATGSYRLDLLGINDGSYLLQLISAGGDAFYLEAIPAAGEGELIEGGGEPGTLQSDGSVEPGTSEVLINTLIWKLCRSYGWGSGCNTNPPKWWAYWCISFAKSGWCSANGSFFP